MAIACTLLLSPMGAPTLMAQAVPYATTIAPAVSQDTVPEDRGAAGLWQTLRKLDTWASLMLITAHPDDEDGGMLTYQSRGAGVRTSLLSLTRGEGGQNAMSGESYDALGLSTHAGVAESRSVLRHRADVDSRRGLRLLENHRRGLCALGQGTRAL